MLKKIALLGVVAAGVLSGCGSSWDDGGASATYAPAAYYQTVDNVYECYYLTSPAEVDALKAAGLCPAGAMPMLMPMAYEEEYWDYWSSPAYYNTYIPAAYRTHFTSVTVVTLNHSSSFQRGVSTLSSRAVYSSSTGGTVTGSKVNTAKFGGGNRQTTTYTGSRRSPANPTRYNSAGRK